MFRTTTWALAGVLGLAVALPAPAGPTSEQEEVKAVVQAYFDALNAGDVERIVALYSNDAVFLPKDAPAARGIAAIERTYRQVLGNIDLDTRHEYFEIAVDGPVAVVESRSNGTLTVKETGKTKPTSNNELFVLRRDDAGSWRISRYMFNGSGQASDVAN